MIKHEEPLEVLLTPGAQLINDGHLAWVEAEADIRTRNRLVWVFLLLFVFPVLIRHQVRDFVGVSATFVSGSGPFEHDPRTLVVDVAVQLCNALELGDDDAVHSHDVSNVDHMGQHPCVVGEELDGHEGLRLVPWLGQG